MTTTQTTATTTVPSERAELLETLRAHRGFLRHTLRGLTEEQARLRTTVSALTLGGLVKHVAATEAQWADFIVRGGEAMGGGEDAWAGAFSLAEGEMVEQVLERYDEVARGTDELLLALPDLDVSHALPPAPWFEPGASRSARRVFLHLIAETSQHAGHADIIRESLDGARTMG